MACVVVENEETARSRRRRRHARTTPVEDGLDGTERAFVAQSSRQRPRPRGRLPPHADGRPGRLQSSRLDHLRHYVAVQPSTATSSSTATPAPASIDAAQRLPRAARADDNAHFRTGRYGGQQQRHGTLTKRRRDYVITGCDVTDDDVTGNDVGNGDVADFAVAAAAAADDGDDAVAIDTEGTALRHRQDEGGRHPCGSVQRLEVRRDGHRPTVSLALHSLHVRLDVRHLVLSSARSLV